MTDHRQLLNSIKPTDQVNVTTISSISNRSERDRLIREFVSRAAKSDDREVVLVAVVKR